MTTKFCSRCKTEKDLESDFNKDKSKKDGHDTYCKECKKEINRLYYEKNKEKVRERNTLWKGNNPEKLRMQRRRWRRKNREKENLTKRQWDKNNPEKKRESLARYQKKNPEKYVTYSQQRRALKRGLPGSHTTEQWLELKKSHNYMCVMCGRSEPEIKLTRDHIIPISRLDLNPTNYIENIQPLCGSCNSRKGKKYDMKKETV